jgi:D-alanyl-D-alanine carboxypeptidase
MRGTFTVGMEGISDRPGISPRVRVLLAVGVLGLATASLSGASAFGAAQPTGTGKALRAALDEVITAPEAPPGLSVLIHRKGQDQFFSRGVADVATGERPTKRLHMRIASVAKAFSGAVALALVSEGKLSLDDTIGERLPGVLPLADNVTLGQALQHTAGLPDYIRDEEFIEVLQADPAQYLTPLQLVEFVADTPLTHAPGTKYEYSDTDNVIVGLMAEAATGLSYDELLQRYVSAPANLRSTSLPTTIEMPEPYLHGYDVLEDAPPFDTSEVINPAGAWASGGIVSTPVDLDRFFRAYVGGDLFSRRVQREQDDFVIGSSQPPGPGRNRATLGLFRYATHCGTVYGHTGSFPGYRVFAASTANGKRSIVFSVSSQIVPGQGSPEVDDLIRFAQEDAVCHARRR